MNTIAASQLEDISQSTGGFLSSQFMKGCKFGVSHLPQDYNRVYSYSIAVLYGSTSSWEIRWVSPCARESAARSEHPISKLSVSIPSTSRLYIVLFPATVPWRLSLLLHSGQVELINRKHSRPRNNVNRVRSYLVCVATQLIFGWDYGALTLEGYFWSGHSRAAAPWYVPRHEIVRKAESGFGDLTRMCNGILEPARRP